MPSTHTGVTYRPEVYVGGLRHLIIFVVDGLVLAFSAKLPLGIAWTSGSPLVAVLFFGVASCYLALLKLSRFRTPGYWVTNAMIVTIDGAKPSPLRMTLRIIWMFNWLWTKVFLLDLLWTTVDDDRQMLRDLLAGTRLVRNKAVPAGPGKSSIPSTRRWGLVCSFRRSALSPRQWMEQRLPRPNA